ncbi:HD domain-containing protein [Desertivirga brevis]|uniref:HD domain-containing protein n=1 Tax=Desertivirga brevis TaxID=2810310 RepID=UPI001A95ADCF|nr:HD domain-containing protein [Pedobacter sp. SYSU D00873]
MNKKKIINDPVYGFITIHSELLFDLIEHPYFQRLRNIKQLGMTHLVYPGALHTRFHHALGAMHLMGLAIETLRSKGHDITPEEEEAVTVAILLHDIGHGPFSHALEHTIVEGINHEHISTLLMNNLNTEFGGRLTMALEIFNNRYPKSFLYQLVSGQLDLDRMDYLNRDSFFTGVSEGIIGFDRIIKMLDVADGQIVIEEKGIYSIEKFLIARRLMYWQVYLHKTVIAGEQLLVKILERAKWLALQGRSLFATPNFAHFLNNSVTRKDFEEDPGHLECFAGLDDFDIFTSVKVWTKDEDWILSELCRNLVRRNLYQVEVSSEPPETSRVSRLVDSVVKKYGVSYEEATFFVFTTTIRNSAYRADDGMINLLMKDGTVRDITVASDNSNLAALAKTVKKHILCHTKGL